MKTIDKISKYGNIIFATVLYTMFTMAIGLVVGDRITKYYQAERLMGYDWYDDGCLDRIDVNWIIYGINE